jgi:hypothetical protein
MFLASVVCADAQSLPPGHSTSQCAEVSHHPSNGGYYIEGVAGVLNDVRSSTTGQRADNTTWAPNTYYPHAEMKLCTGMFCSEEASVNGTAQYVVAHTCGLFRFTYQPPSNVYQMADLDHFERCDVTGATEVCGANDGQPCDYNIEVDHEKTYYYFASNPGCPTGQKVALEVVDDYATNSATCASMGLGSSRIQNCDCGHQLRPTTLIDPCFTGFYQGCMSDMPDDTSCCNPNAAYSSGSYSNCGTCIPKSREADMLQTVADTVALCESNATACDAYLALASCPSSWGPSYDPMCNQWKSIQACISATDAALEACDCDLRWVVYQRHLTQEESSGTCALGLGKLALVVLAVALALML